MLHETIAPRWAGRPLRSVLVCATGPSFTPEVARACSATGLLTIAVSDAYTLLPHAEYMYSNDAAWWALHRGAPTFDGERWSSHDYKKNHKTLIAGRYGIELVHGVHEPGFSYAPTHINYGRNSGFQAINLAILFGARKLTLFGFDMNEGYGRHFFGDHPAAPGIRRNTDHSTFVKDFRVAAETLRPDIHIVVGNPTSALDFWPRMPYEEALAAAEWESE